MVSREGGEGGREGGREGRRGEWIRNGQTNESLPIDRGGARGWCLGREGREGGRKEGVNGKDFSSAVQTEGRKDGGREGRRGAAYLSGWPCR